MTPDHEALLSLGRVTHDAARAARDRSALDLYRRGRDAAQQRLPGPLGVAVAATLGFAAYERAGSPLEPTSLGEPEYLLALALAVLDLPPDTP